MCDLVISKREEKFKRLELFPNSQICECMNLRAIELALLRWDMSDIGGFRPASAIGAISEAKSIELPFLTSLRLPSPQTLDHRTFSIAHRPHQKVPRRPVIQSDDRLTSTPDTTLAHNRV
jgi:hypothetical protein